MKQGKKICKTLKAIRQQIADANGISYAPTPCTHKGDCAGTCPACEAEVRYIEHELNARRLLGKAVVVAGLSMSLMPLTAFSQNISSDKTPQKITAKSDSSRVLDGVVEQMPSFRGGQQALMTYLSQNVKYPKECEDSAIQGRVVCSFMVEKDGSLSDFKVIKSVHPKLDAEALRVIKQMPKWFPGKILGEATRVKFTLPISFRLNKDPQNKKTNSF